MRGKDTDEAFYQTDDRITPAYAGKRDMPAPQSVST